MADIATDSNTAGDRSICVACIGDHFLWNQIECTAAYGTCSYCDAKGRTVSIANVAGKVWAAFKEYYAAGEAQPIQPLPWEDGIEGKESWPVLDRVMKEAGLARRAPAEDIMALLFESDEPGPMDGWCNWSPGSYCTRRVARGLYGLAWNNFDESFRREARYFNPIAQGYLPRIFGGLDQHKTNHWKETVKDWGPGTSQAHLYRARVVSNAQLDEIRSDPVGGMGPPPHHLAKAGRMNAHGIAVFYGATRPEVAVAEVRPPAGSTVVVARFDFVKPITLLDARSLGASPAGSLFDPEYGNRFEQLWFLKDLNDLISKPVFPDDEPMEYLTTQAVCDFLENQKNPSLDGIIYRSAQTNDACNVVLFRSAAWVRHASNPSDPFPDLNVPNYELWKPRRETLQYVSADVHRRLRANFVADKVDAL